MQIVLKKTAVGLIIAVGQKECFYDSVSHFPLFTLTQRHFVCFHSAVRKQCVGHHSCPQGANSLIREIGLTYIQCCLLKHIICGLTDGPCQKKMC